MILLQLRRVRMYAAFLLKHRYMKKLLGLLLYFGVRNQAM